MDIVEKKFKIKILFSDEKVYFLIKGLIKKLNNFKFVNI